MYQYSEEQRRTSLQKRLEAKPGTTDEYVKFVLAVDKGLQEKRNSQLYSQNSTATNNSMGLGATPQETSITNNDGSITITRERQIDNNGTMQTQTGRIRLMPQHQSANGAPAVVDSKIKSNLFDFSEHRGGEEIAVSSGTRTATQNVAVGGAGGSQHLIGNAADIKVGNGDSSKVAEDAYHSNIFDRVNIYSNGRAHVDNKPRPSGSMGFYREWQRVGNVTPRTKPTPPVKKR